MKRLLAIAAAASLVCCFATAQENEEVAPVKIAEPYQQPYVGEDATGDHVVALWNFDAGTELLDASGNGHDLTLNGAKIIPDGWSGGCLESDRGWPVVDDPHQAVAKASPDLTPKGAFTVEMWLAAKPELADYPESFLFDNRYVDETGMQLILGRDRGNGRALRMGLGFGDETVWYSSRELVFETDVWHHIAFTYDGEGTGSFFVDGKAFGGDSYPGRGSVVPGVKRLNIGDRVGSLYHGFPGYIDQVRLCKGALQFSPASFEVTSVRRVFQRMEPDATVTFAVLNHKRETLSGAKVSFMLSGVPQPSQLIPDVASGERYLFDMQIDTSLRPDDYRLAATVDVPGDEPYRGAQEFEISIMPRLPKRMPVLMWGGAMGQVDQLADLGFTHCLGTGADFAKIWDAGEPTDPSTPEGMTKAIETLDLALKHGIGLCTSLSPGRWARSKDEYRRIKPDGTFNGDDVCGNFPEVQKFCYNVGASVAEAYGNHPALQACLIHTEVRGGTKLCYHDHDRELFRQATGLEIPEGLASYRSTAWNTIDNFPADRVIPDDYPMYVYYKWFWGDGDGWNALHNAVNNGIKSAGNEDLWTFHDPAVRTASVFGSGGQVDYLSHWTYSYPDPIRIALCTDELFCMARGSSRPDQGVMKMTQIIWYRNQTAPQPGEEVQVQTGDFVDQDTRPSGTGSVDASGRYVAAWEREIPGARFITIAPMQLREALWTKIARPIQGIMYHGWGSLIKLENQHGSYRYTNPETKWELKRLVNTVIRPLGPTLMEIPDRPADVAFLQSFASEMFARKGTWGWNGGWIGDAYLIMQYADLQTRVVYEQTIQKEGLDDFKVLVMPDCDVLPRSVVDAVQAFQDRGGIVIGDENLCPAIQPDILMPSQKRSTQADVARAANIKTAMDLRAQLDAHYGRYADSSTPNVITRVRAYGSTDYLFAVNDQREFGDYVGHHGLVMENGLPTDANLTIRHPSAHAYDLVAHREVKVEAGNGFITIPQNFGPCEGRVLMITDHAVDAVQVTAPATAAPGDSITLAVAVVGDDGKPMDAIVPVEVKLLDPSGRAAEFSGYYAAKDGTVSIDAQLAINDMPGVWRIEATELASGRTNNAYMRVAATN